MSASGETSLPRRITDFLSDYTIEITPGAAAKVERFDALLPAGKRVMITFLPGTDVTATRAVAVRLAEEGFVPVPHFAARSFESHAQFADSVKFLSSEAGVREAVVLAGAVPKPLGPFDSSIALLETGAFEENGYTRIGLAGHPEGSPDISTDDLAHALRVKNEWATARPDLSVHLVTQFCFEAEPVLAWERAIRSAGNRLPIWIGLPGPAQIKTLIRHAQECGVGNSIRFLLRQSKNIARLVTVNAPDKLLLDLVRGVEADADCLIRGVHCYPLGGLRKSALWAEAVVAGKFELDAKGTGLKVDVSF